MRVYPSQQDTNITAKGSLILSIDSSINYVTVFVNNNLTNIEYSSIDGLYSYGINIGDVVRIETSSSTYIDIIRKDYTTDDIDGDNGIRNTSIIGTVANNYTFTATTVNSGYNFEYLITVGIFPPTATPTPTPTATPTPTPTPTPINITLERGYFGSNGSTGSTKTVETEIVTNGVTYTYSGLTWTTSINDREGKSATIIPVNPSFSFTRRICKTGSAQSSTFRQFVLEINGSVIATQNFVNSISITDCSTYVTQTVNFNYTGTISSGDTVACLLIETL